MKTHVTREEVLVVDLERHTKEVDRLRAENRTLANAATGYAELNKKLRAENRALREALQAYVSTDAEMQGSTSKAATHNDRLDRARAALRKAGVLGE